MGVLVPRPFLPHFVALESPTLDPPASAQSKRISVVSEPGSKHIVFLRIYDECMAPLASNFEKNVLKLDCKNDNPEKSALFMKSAYFLE